MFELRTVRSRIGVQLLATVIANLVEGVRADVMNTPIKVSVIYPGYIRSEMNERMKKTPMFMVSTEKGVSAIVQAIEKEKPHAHVPAWPWVPFGFVMRHAPLPLVRRLMG